MAVFSLVHQRLRICGAFFWIYYVISVDGVPGYEYTPDSPASMAPWAIASSPNNNFFILNYKKVHPANCRMDKYSQNSSPIYFSKTNMLKQSGAMLPWMLLPSPVNEASEGTMFSGWAMELSSRSLSVVKSTLRRAFTVSLRLSPVKLKSSSRGSVEVFITLT